MCRAAAGKATRFILPRSGSPPVQGDSSERNLYVPYPGSNMNEVTRPVTGSPAEVHLSGLVPSGRRTARASLASTAKISAGHGHVTDHHPFHRLPLASLAAVRAGLASRHAVSTANHSVGSVRSGSGRHGSRGRSNGRTTNGPSPRYRRSMAPVCCRARRVAHMWACKRHSCGPCAGAVRAAICGPGRRRV